MKNTKIPWCDHTFNPWLGCQEVSPACDNCYAREMAHRLKQVEWGGIRKRTSPGYWRQPLRWNHQARLQQNAWIYFDMQFTGLDEHELQKLGIIKPQRPKVFCGSMCDVFDNQVPQAYQLELFELIKNTQYLDWLLLTKRIGNVTKLYGPMWEQIATQCWLGISVCNQDEADREIPKLLKTPAAKHFLSIEPMLGPIDISRWLEPQCDNGSILVDGGGVMCRRCQGNGTSCSAIDWVIVGGESGHNARPIHPLWVESVRDQCHAANIPFFFKQWGEWAPRYKHWFTLGDKDLQTIDPQCKRWPRVIRLTESGKDGRAMENVDEGEDVFMQRIGIKKAGCLLSGCEYLNFPEN